MIEQSQKTAQEELADIQARNESELEEFRQAETKLHDVMNFLAKPPASELVVNMIRQGNIGALYLEKYQNPSAAYAALMGDLSAIGSGISMEIPRYESRLGITHKT